MRRRNFLKLTGVAGLMATLGGLEWMRIRDLVCALAPRRYPGRVIPLDHRKIAKAGRWQG